MSTISVVRGLNNSGLPDRIFAGSTVLTGWTNANFGGSLPPTGDDPIDLMLRILMSTGSAPSGPFNWSGTGTNYDYYEAGIGLGIPQDQIDIASFTNIQAQYDYDPNRKVFFHLTQSEAAKDFLEQELCKPFRFYLCTGNAGRIRLIQPRHPQKFYVGAGNNSLQIRYPSGTGPTYTATLPSGVFDADTLAAKVQQAVWAAIPAWTSEFSCTYDHATHKFSVGFTLPFDLFGAANGWATLGWTTLPATIASSPSPAPNARGQFTGTTLTQDDLWGVQILDNREDQITSVLYQFDYDVDTDTFRSVRRYSDPEATNLGDTLCPCDYVISARGLISAGPNAGPPIAFHNAPASGCDPVRMLPIAASGVDADSWAQVYAQTLVDRYKYPPVKFRARLKWKWNTLEVGDVVNVNYSIPGVFVDLDRNATTLTNRLFEIVELHPNFDGSLDATFLGHRYVSY